MKGQRKPEVTHTGVRILLRNMYDNITSLYTKALISIHPLYLEIFFFIYFKVFQELNRAEMLCYLIDISKHKWHCMEDGAV